MANNSVKNHKKLTDITTIESVLNVVQRVTVPTANKDALQLQNIFFSPSKVLRYDFSNKKIHQGDCVNITQEDDGGGTSISFIGYVLSAAPQLNHIKCIIFLRPESLPTARLPWMGRREIFLTNLICHVPRQLIHDKVIVTSLDDLKVVKDRRKNRQLYYSRVCYDVDDREFFNYSTMQFLCLCVQPKNPDRTFIHCEYNDDDGNVAGCGALYHPRCVGTSRKLVDEIGEFKCPLCKRKTKEKKKACDKSMLNDKSNNTKRNEFRNDEAEEKEIAAKLETLSRIDPTTLMLGFERCQRHPNCSKPNRHPARCKLDRNNETKISTGSGNNNKKTKRKQRGKNMKEKNMQNDDMNIGSLPPRNNSKKQINEKQESYVAQGFNFNGQGKGLSRVPKPNDDDVNDRNKNINKFHKRQSGASEANTPSRRKFVKNKSLFKQQGHILTNKTGSGRPLINLRRHATQKRKQKRGKNSVNYGADTSSNNDVRMVMDGYPTNTVSPPPFAWASSSSIDMPHPHSTPKRPLSMGSLSDGEDHLIPGIEPLGSMEFDEMSNIPPSPMGILRGGMSDMFLSIDTHNHRQQQRQQREQQQQQQPSKVIAEILNSPLTKYSSPSLHDLFDYEEQQNVFTLPEPLLGIGGVKINETRNGSTNNKKKITLTKANGRRQKKSIKRRKTSSSSSGGSDGANTPVTNNNLRKVLSLTTPNSNNDSKKSTFGLFGKISVAQAKQSNMLSIFDNFKNPPPSPLIKPAVKSKKGPMSTI